MPLAHQLAQELETWTLLHTLELSRLLGKPQPRVVRPEHAMAWLLSIRAQPADLPQPLAIEVEGRKPTALILSPRGEGALQTTDLLVTDELFAILQSFKLPEHAVVECDAVPLHISISERDTSPRGVRIRQRSKLRLRWLWWKDRWDQIDFDQSSFLLLYEDGSKAEARYECLEDCEQVRRRGRRGGPLVVPAHIVWMPVTGAAAGDFDLDPGAGGTGPTISSALAGAITSAALPGIVIR